MNKFHTISHIQFIADEMHITIDDNKRIFSLEKISPVLKNASDSARKNFQLSPSGYGIHWPELDEDLSIDGLLGITHESGFKKHAA